MKKCVKFFLYRPTCILCFEYIFRRADLGTILVSIVLIIFKVIRIWSFFYVPNFPVFSVEAFSEP